MDFKIYFKLCVCVCINCVHIRATQHQAIQHSGIEGQRVYEAPLPAEDPVTADGLWGREGLFSLSL